MPFSGVWALPVKIERFQVAGKGGMVSCEFLNYYLGDRVARCLRLKTWEIFPHGVGYSR